jgi:hypothetical protein
MEGRQRWPRKPWGALSRSEMGEQHTLEMENNDCDAFTIPGFDGDPSSADTLDTGSAGEEP